MKYVAYFLLFALALPAQQPPGRILRIQISTVSNQPIVGARVVAQTQQEAARYVMKPMALTRRLPDLPPQPPLSFSMAGGTASAIPGNPKRCRTDIKAPRFPVPNP